ncbi:hypothetical protein FFT09_22570 [Saccharomonospora piscinae]|nr:hypothetical protein FFT09_22570 [Saccharomonospora piscinae]
MAGERRGMGLRGRLSVYASGKAAVSGLGEAAFTRALADPAWVRERLIEIDAGHPLTAKQWAQAALRWAQLWLCWTQTTDRASAVVLEKAVITALQATPLWNTRR